MKWLRLFVLLLLTLAAMRAGSWALGWALAKLAHAEARFTSAVSNAVAFLLFIGLLLWNLYPGEPVDIAAVVFGAVVFGVYGLTDLYWRPWKARG